MSGDVKPSCGSCNTGTTGHIRFFQHFCTEPEALTTFLFVAEEVSSLISLCFVRGIQALYGFCGLQSLCPTVIGPSQFEDFTGAVDLFAVLMETPNIMV